jgi:hypothetical protein
MDRLLTTFVCHSIWSDTSLHFWAGERRLSNSKTYYPIRFNWKVEHRKGHLVSTAVYHLYSRFNDRHPTSYRAWSIRRRHSPVDILEENQPIDYPITRIHRWIPTLVWFVETGVTTNEDRNAPFQPTSSQEIQTSCSDQNRAILDPTTRFDEIPRCHHRKEVGLEKSRTTYRTEMCASNSSATILIENSKTFKPDYNAEHLHSDSSTHPILRFPTAVNSEW